MRIEYHRTLIADAHRNEAFRRALAAAIEPGRTTVADIGAGTGLIGLMAARLGAREVHLYEAAEVAGIASETLKRNRVRNCHLYACHSTDMDRPPKVDVVVSETLGNYAFEEDIITTMRDAVARHLKPGGTIIPARITQHVAPVVTPRVHQELTAWERVQPTIDLSHAQRMSLNNIYVRTFAPGELAGGTAAAKQWDAVHLAHSPSNTRKGDASWLIAHSAPIYGFAIWWIADLGHGIVLSTAPNAPRTHWEQLYLPLLKPFDVSQGDTVSIAIRSRTSEQSGTVLKWTATHSVGMEVVSRQSLDLEKGYLP